MATVVITGANRGIGLAMTRHYASRGDRVIALTRDPAASTELAQIAKGSTAIGIHAADVTDEASLAAAAKAAGATAVDIVVCNAGIMSSRGGLAAPGYDAAEWQRVLMTNVAGPFFTARAFLPGLKKAKAGKLAIISSMMGSSTQASGNVYGYRASKAAAANLGANLAVELKGLGIAVGIFHPGWVSSDMGGASAPVTPAASAKGLVARIDTLSLATSGVFEDFQGQPYAF
jgi:NAD(P)-dependent dehydrogenase (short-subunit alcohol dehydrogenase family)